ncbi:MAG: dienelactone hydrolase family protein [Acidobacteriales bacterium]|nr:dienelactone hydrolase family protein [Terriglobales bacterium]
MSQQSLKQRREAPPPMRAKFLAATPGLLFTLICATLVSCGGASANSSAGKTPSSSSSLSFQGAQYPYAVFVPSTYNPAHPMPAILLIHGSGSNGAYMLNLWQTFAEKNGIILVAPTLPLGAGFEAISPQVFEALMELVKKQYSLDSHRIYLFGYSAGGYSTFYSAMFDSTYFAGAGVFAGIITPDYFWILQRAQRKIPIALYIGDHDQYFSFAQTRATRDALLANGFPVHYVEIANQDHNYPAIADKVNQDVWNYLRQYSLP